jgi:hypothetical protein
MEGKFSKETSTGHPGGGASAMPDTGLPMPKKQLPKQQEQRDQKQLETDHFSFGSQGAEFCRKIDVASVEEAALSMRRERAAPKPS